MKTVEARTFSTVRIEEIEWEDGVLDSKDIKWYRLSDGKLIAHESFDWENEEWKLFMERKCLDTEASTTH